MMEDYYGPEEMTEIARSAVITPYAFTQFSFVDMQVYVCMELFLVTGKIDAILPTRNEVASFILRNHTVAELDAHFGTRIIMASLEIIGTFSDKGWYARWMRDNGLGQYIPTQYMTESDIVWPCLIKAVDKDNGDGIELVYNASALAAAQVRYGAGAYMLQEALPGTSEPTIHWIARNGKVLTFACLVHRQITDLFVLNAGAERYGADMVDCREYDRISATLHVASSIIAETRYNGFGCIGFKFTPDGIAQSELNAIMSAMVPLDHFSLHPEPTTTTKATGKYIATPRFYDFNTRVGGNLIKGNSRWVAAMLMLYLDDA